jgi:ankyrin repeat protein
LSRGADPNIATANGETALTFAKDKHRVETIRLLEEAGAR